MSNAMKYVQVQRAIKLRFTFLQLHILFLSCQNQTLQHFHIIQHSYLHHSSRNLDLNLCWWHSFLSMRLQTSVGKLPDFITIRTVSVL